MATEAAQSGTTEVPPDVSEHLTTDDRVGLLRAMLMMRGIEERAMTLYRQGKVPGSFYDGFGQEAVSAGPAWAMAADDRLCILHRDLAAHVIRGVPTERIFAQYMGREGGITGGRDGNVHFGDRTMGCVGMVSMLPDMMLVATGLAMAFKLRGERACAMTWFGDGSTSRGDFHEAMNWAGAPAAAGHLRPREQPVRLLDAGRPAVRRRPGRARGGLRLPGRQGRRQRLRGDVRGHPPGARARAGRRGPDADRGGDDAHARPRRPRRHEVRARGAGRGVAAKDPIDRQVRRLEALGDRRPGAARGGQGGDRGGRRGRAREPDARRRDRHRPRVRRRAGAARGRQRAVERVPDGGA